MQASISLISLSDLRPSLGHQDLLLRLLHQLTDIFDVRVFQAISASHRQFQLIDTPIQVVVEVLPLDLAGPRCLPNPPVSSKLIRFHLLPNYLRRKGEAHPEGKHFHWSISPWSVYRNRSCSQPGLAHIVGHLFTGVKMAFYGCRPDWVLVIEGSCQAGTVSPADLGLQFHIQTGFLGKGCNRPVRVNDLHTLVVTEITGPNNSFAGGVNGQLFGLSSVIRRTTFFRSE